METSEIITQKQLLNRARRYRRRVNATFHAYKGNHDNSELPYIVYAVDALNWDEDTPAIDIRIRMHGHFGTYRIAACPYSGFIKVFGKLTRTLKGATFIDRCPNTAEAIRSAVEDLHKRRFQVPSINPIRQDYDPLVKACSVKSQSFLRQVEPKMDRMSQLQTYPYRLTYCPVDTDTTGPRCYDA